MSNLNEFLKKMMAIPYVHKGRGYDGADCGGAIMIFYRDFLGITLPDFNIDYDEDWTLKSDKSLFIENYYKFFDKVDKPESFDIILFQNKRGIAYHGGIVLSNGKFLHLSKSGVSINRYSEETFQRSLNGFYHYKKV
jgi:cell wall-associated NlpC family hydrolase